MNHTDRQELVVVTGTSTGMGAATARELARKGFHVLAGVRRQADADKIGADAGSKFALEAVSDALRREVSAAGIKVVVEPGAVKTEMAERGIATAQGLQADMTADQLARYGDITAAVAAQAQSFNETGVSAEHAATVIAAAATAANPALATPSGAMPRCWYGSSGWCPTECWTGSPASTCGGSAHGAVGSAQFATVTREPLALAPVPTPKNLYSASLSERVARQYSQV